MSSGPVYPAVGEGGTALDTRVSSVCVPRLWSLPVIKATAT